MLAIVHLPNWIGRQEPTSTTKPTPVLRRDVNSIQAGILPMAIKHWSQINWIDSDMVINVVNKYL
jgi:hypothetical protein